MLSYKLLWLGSQATSASNRPGTARISALDHGHPKQGGQVVRPSVDPGVQRPQVSWIPTPEGLRMCWVVGRSST